MRITVRRDKERLKGTYWRPVQHALHQLETIESVRREVPGDTPDKLIRRKREVRLEAMDKLLAGSRSQYTEARIESPYKMGHFVEGFVYVRAMAAFVHEDEVSWAEKIAQSIGAGAIISKRVQIEDGVRIGNNVELERGVHVMHGASVGPYSVLRKGARVDEDAQVGAHTYIGQRMKVGKGAIIGSMGIFERGVNISSGVDVGRQGHIGLDTFVAPNVWLDDSVRIGRGGFIGSDSMIGEMTNIGDYTHIGNRVTIGAESQFGRFVRVAQNVILISPTFAEDGAFIAKSNLTAPRSL